MKRTLLALTTVALAAGCTSAASSTTHTTPPPSPASSQPLVVHHPTPHHVKVRITWKDKGHVVRVHRGDTVDLRLPTTFWDVVTPQSIDVLNPLLDAVPTRAGLPPSCVPGGGCGTTEVEYRAVHAGRVTLRAHRNSCGEAMRCVAGRGRFSVTVVVT